MAGQRIDNMELRSLITLKKQGLSNRKVSGLLNINRKTVNTYVNRFQALGLSYGELLELDSADLQDLFVENSQREKERYEQLSSHFSYYLKELKKPGCTLQHLWNDYLAKYPDGYKYTQFTWHYRQWRKLNSHSGKLEHKAGEKLFIDFCGKKLSYVDKSTGEQIEAEVFVGVLPCSQYTFVKAVASQKREDLISCMVSCLGWMGGVPQAIVSDNLKSAVSKGSKYAPLINKTLADFALHYGCAVDPARPHHPQDKALVERHVTLVYQRIFYPLSRHTFFSLSELNDAVSDLSVTFNDHLFSHGAASRRSQFIDIEKEFMQPLPTGIYSLRYYKKAKVQRTSHVYLNDDRNYYSCPYRFTGMQVDIQYNGDVVEIFHNQERIAGHKRCYKAGHYTTVAGHMPSAHQFYGKWNPAFFEDWARKSGPDTLAYIQRLLGQYPYPEVAYKQAQGILSFIKMYGSDRLEKACKRALEFHVSSYHTIEKILKNRMDMIEPQEEPSSPRPAHKDIRGAKNYR